jgi:hypothetical protein
MWINDKITYTPEVITITRGNPVSAVVESVGTDGKLAIRFPDGTQDRIDASLCQPA